MSIVWNTPAGRIDILQERVYTEIPLNASTTQPSTSIEYSLISGSLPRGMRLSNTGVIKGSPVEEFKYTSFRFVIRADDGLDVIDRTFSIDIDGYDEPYWVTREGFLNVGPQKTELFLDSLIQFLQFNTQLIQTVLMTLFRMITCRLILLMFIPTAGTHIGLIILFTITRWRLELQNI